MKISAKGLIFDYGGTIDTNGVHWGIVIWKAYRAFRVPVSYAAYREAYVYGERTLGSRPIVASTHTFRDVLRIKLELQFAQLQIEDKQVAHKIADECYRHTVDIVERAKVVLDELYEKYLMVLVSNFYGNIRTVLDEFGLSGYFKAVIESAEVGIRKPDPAIYRLGIESLGVSQEEAVIIGDSYKNDILPAAQLGCRSIWLRGQGWDDRDEDKEHPCIITDFAELPQFFC